MIVIEQCRVDEEGKCLIVDAAVENLDYYDEVLIDSVIIGTEDTYTPNTPHGKTIKVGGKKSIRLRLKPSDIEDNFNFNDHIIYVYIRATGIPSVNCPCGMDNEYTVGIALNLRPIYNMAIQYIKELSSDCSIPSRFTDMILKLKGLDLALKTGNYTTANSFWNKFFKKKIKLTYNNNCGCHGTS